FSPVQRRTGFRKNGRNANKTPGIGAESPGISPGLFAARSRAVVAAQARSGGGAMTASPVYEASPIRRTRATKAEVEARREALLDIIEAGRPMTVRQVFYQATVRGLVEKAESGYAKVQTDLTVMRRAGELPYDWLADNTRWQRKPRTFSSVE